MAPQLELTDGAVPDDEHSSGEPSPVLDWTIRAVIYPVKLAVRLLGIAFQVARPHAPQLVPLLFCVLLLPVLAFFSLSAGFVVWKTSAVSWEQPVYLQYGDGVPPYADVPLDISPLQAYDISLHLSVPALESNYALGNFMASLTLSTPANTTLTSIRRPAVILAPPSSVPILRQAKRTLDLDIPLLSGYIVRTSRPIARVEIGRRDHWKSIGHGEGRELTVLSATLRGTLRHHGVRGAFSRFPLVTAGIAGTAFFVIAAAVVGVCLLTATRLYTTYGDETNAAYRDEHAVEQVAEVVNEKPRRRASQESLTEGRKRKSTSRRSSRTTDVKIEPEESAMPLRRRVSRPSIRTEE